MHALQHRMAVIGGKSYNRIPLKMLKAIPAGFPLPLHDDMFGVAGHSDAIFSNIQSGGEDLRAFTDLALTNEIPLELIEINTGSNLIKGFVRVPSALSINDKIYLRTTVGGGETAPAADSTNGSEAVWQDYDLVIHGNDPETDVTGNHGTITSTGGVSLSGANLLNAWPAYAYGASQGIATTDNIKITNATNSAVKTEMTFAYKDGTEDSTSGRLAAWEIDNEHHRKMDVDDFYITRKRSTTNQITQATAGEITDDAWHMFGFTFDDTVSAVDIRLNKTNPTLTQQNGSGTLTQGSGTKTLMNRNDNGRAFTGRFVEHRQRPDTTPDDAWMDLEDDTFRDPGAIAEAEALAVI